MESQNPTPFQIPPNSAAKSKKWLWIVLIVIIGVVLFYLDSQLRKRLSLESVIQASTSETVSDWKTFAKSGSTFKYPANLEMLQDKVSNDYIFISSSGHNEIPYTGYEAGIPYKKAQLVLEEFSFTPNDAYKTAKEYFNTISGTRILVDGFPAVIADQEDTFGHALTNYHTTRAYILKNENDLVSLGTVIFPEDTGESANRKQLLDKILATFKITS